MTNKNTGNDSVPIIDGHNDSLYSIVENPDSNITAFIEGRRKGHVDLPRAREGKLCAGFFALGIPTDPNAKPDDEILITDDGYEVPLANPIDSTFALKAANQSIKNCLRLENLATEQIKIIRCIKDLKTCLSNDTLGIILHLEGAEPIDSDLKALPILVDAGLKSIGIVWSRPNIFGTGVAFRFPHSPNIGPGLTDIGKELIKACNQLGVLIDAAHLNEAGFWDLVATSEKPIIASHTAAHAICPNSRNLTNRQLDAIRDSDGLVGVNFEVSALRSDGKDESNTPIEQIVRHIDYLVQRIGISRVAFGSDFDGATMSTELPDAAALPKLVHALKIHGYTDHEVSKIAYQNWYRVLNQTWV